MRSSPRSKPRLWTRFTALWLCLGLVVATPACDEGEGEVVIILGGGGSFERFFFEALIEGFRRLAEVRAPLANLPAALPPVQGPVQAPPVTPTPTPHSANQCFEKVTGIPESCPEIDVPAAANRTGGGEILPFNGQEMLDAVDLFIPGRDAHSPFRILRRHISRITQTEPTDPFGLDSPWVGSPFGLAWAFNYDHHFVTDLNADLLTMRAFGRSDVFAKKAPNVWEGATGRYGRLVYDGNQSAELLTPGGMKLEFLVWQRGESVIAGIVSRIESPNGNAIELEYTLETIPDRFGTQRMRLEVIRESFGREIRFFYEDPDYPYGVSRIQDFSGREVHYDYNGLGQLLAVRSPAVQSTSGVNDFPQGKTTTYRYYTGRAFEELLQNPGVWDSLSLVEQRGSLEQAPEFGALIESVVFPNEQGTGETRLSWTYYTHEARPLSSSVEHERLLLGAVRTHTIGNSGADPESGGAYTYSYEYLGMPELLDDPVVRATITDRRGTVTVQEYTATGQLLTETVQTQGLRAGAPSGYTRSFVYNADGDLLESLDPNGIRTIHAVTDDPSVPRRSQANEVAREVLPAPGMPTDQTRIRYETAYEPIFNRPFRTVDPRGFEPGNDPADFTTIYVYDYMEDLQGAKAFFAPRLGMSEAELQALFDAAGIVSTGDVNGDGLTSQRSGNVVQILHPRVVLSEEATRIGLPTEQLAAETFAYNAFGQRTRHVDGEGNVTRWDYYGANDPDGDGVIDVPGADPSTGGYLRAEIRDAESAPGRNSGRNPTPVQQRIEYQYTAQGDFPANPRGVPTAILDPRGIKHTFLVNELDQIVKEVRAADVSASPESGLTSFAYEQISLYDANDNLVEVRIQNRDTLTGEDDFIVHRFDYDILDQLTEQVFDVGGLEITNHYAYDPSQNPIVAIHAAGTAEQTITELRYDERDLLISATRGAGAPEASTTSNQIDANGNVVTWVDADGDEAEILRDGYDRPRETIDRVGNRTVLTYDAASNVVGVQHLGPAEDSPGAPEERLAEVHRTYDTRSRLVREDRRLFHYPGQEVGALDPGDLDARSPSPACQGAPCVSQVFLYDRGNRLVGLVDGDDDTHGWQYDGLSRLVETQDPAGNSVRRVYDPSSNLIGTLEFESSSLLVYPEAFIRAFQYDSLDRLRFMREPNGQLTLYFYDSRDNLIRHRDGEKNDVELLYDRLDRLVNRRAYLSPHIDSERHTARDGSIFNFDASADSLVLAAELPASLLENPSQDLDGDGLADLDEMRFFGTSPDMADSDGDGHLDGAEVAASSDPQAPGSVPTLSLHAVSSAGVVGPNLGFASMGLGDTCPASAPGCGALASRLGYEPARAAATRDADGDGIGAAWDSDDSDPELGVTESSTPPRFSREVQIGDFNVDGRVDGGDAVFAQQILAGEASLPVLYPSGQGGGDGLIDTFILYDDLSRVTHRFDDNFNLTRYVYDDLHRTTEIEYQDGTRERWTYNGDSEVLSHITQNGSVETWSHDANSRPTQVAIRNPAGIVGTTLKRWGYDGLDRVVFSLDDNGAEPDVTVRRAYDSLSRLIRETQGIEGLASYDTELAWKAENQRIATTYPDGRQVLCAYDALDREIQLIEAATGAAIGTFDYVGPWRDARIELGNGVFLDKRNAEGSHTTSGTDPGYDRNRRNILHRWRRPSGELLAGYRYFYNRVNLPVEEHREHLGRGDAFFLDSAYRMTTFRHNAPLTPSGLWEPRTLFQYLSDLGRQSRWKLDGANNWTAYNRRFNEELEPRVDGIGGVNEYTSFAGRPLRYDENGNLQSDGQRQLFYDYSDRLVRVEDSGGNLIAQYLYDSSNRRVLKTRNAAFPSGTSSQTRFLYRGWEVLEEHHVWPDSETLARQYVYRAGIDEPVQMRTPGSGGAPVDHYYLMDGRGNIGALTDASGNARYFVEYDALGDEVNGKLLVSPSDPNTFLTSEPAGNPYFWHGRRRDLETGLYYYRNRYYDPEMARFIQADPMGAWFDRANLGNRYALGAYQPGVKDPLGLQTILDDDPLLDGELASLCGDGPGGYGCAAGMTFLEELLTGAGGRRGVGSSPRPTTNPIKTPSPLPTQTTTSANTPAPRSVPRGQSTEMGQCIERTHGPGGRLERVQGRVGPEHLGTGTATTRAAREAARSMGEPTDDAGHGLAKALGGKGGRSSGNIFPQNPAANRGAQAQVEKEVVDAVKRGRNVSVDIRLNYPNTAATRPSSIDYGRTIDEITRVTTIENP